MPMYIFLYNSLDIALRLTSDVHSRSDVFAKTGIAI